MTTTKVSTDINELAELFIKDRTGEKTPSTIHNNQGHLDHFCGWCEQNNVDSVRELNGQDLLEYKFDLRDGRAKTTVRNHFSTLRTFFRFCNRIDATREDQHLAEKLEAPDFSKGEKSRDDMLNFDVVEKILDYLDTYEYATAKHALFTVFWHTGCRRGALRGLDLCDYKPVQDREHGRYALLQFAHRPETDTPLKNGDRGEREVILWPDHAEVVEDYIEVKRLDKTDEHEREPLFTSGNGRYTASAIQAMIYALTRPCVYGDTCPHNRDVEECPATSYDSASRCPSSVSPHPMRRTAITYHLDQKNWTYEASSGRFDVSVDVLKEHYDESSKEGRRKTRAAQFFDGDQASL